MVAPFWSLGSDERISCSFPLLTHARMNADGRLGPQLLLSIEITASLRLLSVEVRRARCRRLADPRGMASDGAVAAPATSVCLTGWPRSAKTTLLVRCRVEVDLQIGIQVTREERPTEEKNVKGRSRHRVCMTRRTRHAPFEKIEFDLAQVKREKRQGHDDELGKCEEPREVMK